MFFSRAEMRMPEPGQALPGRTEATPVPARHEVLGNPLTPPFPEGLGSAARA